MPAKGVAISTLRAGWDLFSQAERRQIVRLMPVVAIIGIFEIAALASAMPLVAIIIEPDVLERRATLRHLFELMGNPPYESFVAWMTIFVLCALILASVAGYLKNYAIARFAAKCWTRLGHDLMEKSLVAPYSWSLRRNASVLTRLFTHDLTLWARDFVEFLLTFFGDLITIAAAVVLVLWIAPLPGLAAIVAVLVLYIGVLFWVRPRIQHLAEVSRRKSDDLALTANEAFSGAKDIRLSSQEAFFVSAFSQANAKVANARVMISLWSRIAPMLMLLLGQLTLVLMAFALWWARVPTGEIAAMMAVVVLVSARLIPALNRIAANVNKIWTVGPYVSGIHEVSHSLDVALAKRRKRHVPMSKHSPLSWRQLDLREIDFHYGNGAGLVLRDVTLSIERGKTYGLVGPSGAGKSTLVDILLGLLDPEKGDVLIDGRPLAEAERTAWQRKLGYVPQSPFISDDTLRANVAFGVPGEQVDDKWVAECLRAANLASLLDELEDGLDTRMGDRGSRLSGGQKQRLAIARALYKKPDMLVLDEATSALDAINEDAIRKAIQGLRGKVTLVIIAHRLSTIRDADRIFVLDGGILVEQGSYGELERSSVLFSRLMATQSSGVISVNATDEPLERP